MNTTDSGNRLLNRTRLLDFEHPALMSLVAQRGWQSLPEYERIGAVYDFVRNEIAFGYNESDDIPASRVLADGYGQCNTKATLLMALLRAVGIRCRFHGFTIDKALQKGAVTGLAFLLAPRSIIHSWVEIRFDARWISLEGVILDEGFLGAVQRRFTSGDGTFCGYGVATADLQNPPVEWCGRDTFIQKDGINGDFGLFDDPDTFYAAHGANLSGLKRWLYSHFVRDWMNANVARLRAGVSAPSAPAAR